MATSTHQRVLLTGAALCSLVTLVALTATLGRGGDVVSSPFNPHISSHSICIGDTCIVVSIFDRDVRLFGSDCLDQGEMVQHIQSHHGAQQPEMAEGNGLHLFYPAQALYLPHCMGCSLGQHLELILEQYGTPVHAATFHRTEDGDAVSVLHAQDVDPYLSGFAAR